MDFDVQQHRYLWFEGQLHDLIEGQPVPNGICYELSEDFLKSYHKLSDRYVSEYDLANWNAFYLGRNK